MCFWYGNAAARTFGRAHRHRPYAFCLRELRADVRPYGFVWADYVWNGWRRWGGLCVNGYFVCMGLCGKILRSVVGAVPMCPPVPPCRGASIVHSPRMIRDTQTHFWYGNAATRTFGRAHRHRPYGFVGVDCAWGGDVVWVDCTWDGWCRLRRRYGRPLSFPVLPFHPRVNTILLLHATG